jgi:hypothetical protein
MLQKQQQVGDALGAALLDQRPLQLQRVSVRNEAQPANLEGTH